MAREFTPRDLGALAWQAGERAEACPYPSYSGDANAWRCGWREERDKADDAEEEASTDDGLGGWSVAWEMREERRAMGLTALD